MTLSVLLALHPAGGRRAAVEDALRQAIRSGVLAPGARLPSTRALAADLGLSRGTVVAAYDQLAAEGWLVANPASATVVADHLGVGYPLGTRYEVADDEPSPLHDLRPGRAENGSFPRAAWFRAARRVLGEVSDGVFDYAGTLGRPELRSELAAYLARTRGVHTAPEQLMIGAGFSGCLDMLTSTLRPGPFAVEATTLRSLRAVIERRHHQVVDLPVDSSGAVVDALDDLAPRPTAVLVTPSHQFPLGVPLAPERRHQLLGWATAHDALVVEDDYDGEFRYDRHPVGALQGLDPERVVYGGTAAKTLAPAVRLGWMALGPAITADVAAADPPFGANPVATLDQFIFAELLRSGAYDRHVHKMRRRYRQRRDTLVQRLNQRVPGLTVGGVAAGLHLVIWLPADLDLDSVLDACASHRVAISTVAQLSGAGEGHRPNHPADGLVVGYGTPAEHRFPAALDALTAALTAAGLGAQ
jgi:GntR family transcriptional regulator/MocR family aminotransferase